MRSLRVRLTLWFTLAFLAVTSIFMFLAHRRLDVELRHKAFQNEQNINPQWIVRGSYSETEIEEIMAELERVSLLYSLPLVLVTLLVGYWVARKSLSPIDSLNQQLSGVTSRTLGTRVVLPEADEQFRDLLRHLNEMLTRLQRGFQEMSEYSAKVAHELRTPLTIMRLKVEQAAGRVEPDLAEDLQAELHRLTHVVDQSLVIARAEQGRLSWNVGRVDLAAMVEGVVDDFRLLADAEERPLRLSSPAEAWVQTDPKYTRQVLHALLTNALIHGHGAIHVRLKRRGARVRLLLLNRIRRKGPATEASLGLGLRVVRALLSVQPDIRFRQRQGHAWYGTAVEFVDAEPALAVATATVGADPSRREPVAAAAP